MSDKALLQAMGVQDARSLNQARNYHFNQVCRFSSSIAAGATDTFTLKVSSGKAFVVDSLRGVVTAVAAQGSAAITVLTDAFGAAADGTIADVTAAFSQTILNNNFQDIAAKINELITAFGSANQYPAGSELSLGGGRGQNPAALIDIKIEDQRGEWQTDWMPWPTVIGTADKPAYPMFKPAVPAGAELKITLRNNSAVAITAVIVLEGHVLGTV